jgi:hypothetical protein
MWLWKTVSRIPHPPPGTGRIFVRLKEREARQLEKGGGKRREGRFPDKGQEGGFQVCFRGGQKALPFGTVVMEQALPAVESSDRDPVHFTDPFDRPETDGVLRQNTQDEKEAVAAVRDNRVGKHSMR